MNTTTPQTDCLLDIPDLPPSWLSPSSWDDEAFEAFYNYFGMKVILVEDINHILYPYTMEGMQLLSGEEALAQATAKFLTVQGILEEDLSEKENRGVIDSITGFLDALSPVTVEHGATLPTVINRESIQLGYKIDKVKKSTCVQAQDFVKYLKLVSKRKSFQNSKGYFTTVFSKFADIIWNAWGTPLVNVFREVYCYEVNLETKTTACILQAQPDFVFIYDTSTDTPADIIAVARVNQDKDFEKFLEELKNKERRKICEKRCAKKIFVRQTSLRMHDDDHGEQKEVCAVSGGGQGDSTGIEGPSSICNQAKFERKTKTFHKLRTIKKHSEPRKKQEKCGTSSEETDSDAQSLITMFQEMDLYKCQRLNNSEKDYIEKFLPQLVLDIIVTFNKCLTSRIASFVKNKAMRYAIGVSGFKVTFVTLSIVYHNIEDDTIALSPQGFPDAYEKGIKLHTDVFVTKQYDLLNSSDREKIAHTLHALRKLF